MERCLKSPDILLYIIEILYPYEIVDANTSDHYHDRDHTGGRGAIAALAQVCKFFLEPCLNSLWRHLLSLSPLLNTLDDTCVPLRPGEHGPRVFPGLLRNPDQFEDPSKLNWSRFDFYAHRVRSVWTDDDDAIPDSVFFAIGVERRAPLLPNLRHIIWRQNSRSKLPYLSLFCGPALQRLTVYLGNENVMQMEHGRSSIFALMSSLSLHCSSLQALAIVSDKNGDLTETELQDEASWMVLGMRSLRSFSSAITITSKALSRLSSMRSLRAINIVGEHSLDKLVTSPVFFPELEEFTVSDIPLPAVTRFLASFRYRHSFRTVNVSSLGCVSSRDIEPFVRALYSFCNPETLTRLCLHFCAVEHEGSDFDYHDPAVGSHVLTALREFAQLRICSIQACGILWEDQFLKDVAPSWRSLQALELDALGILRPGSNMSMLSLLTVAMLCPDLHNLSLGLANWDTIGVLPGGLRKLDRDHSRPKLHVNLGRVPPNSERRVAAVLRMLFPGVYAAWNRRIEFWIRHDWPGYEDTTEEEYSARPFEPEEGPFTVPFPYPDQWVPLS
ncbi:hypothetical protein DENSPDRAFT_843655 [Dentipellis sp. KUC8613]|nr:hypothetical protein DENSPDRAFT_843655 [Dentipellis sp. KUC8613]